MGRLSLSLATQLLVGNHFLKMYSYYKSRYLLKRNSSLSTNGQTRLLSFYYYKNVFFNFRIFDESLNMHRYPNFSALGDCPSPKNARGQLLLPGYANIYGALLLDIFRPIYRMTLIDIRHKKFFFYSTKE